MTPLPNYLLSRFKSFVNYNYLPIVYNELTKDQKQATQSLPAELETIVEDFAYDDDWWNDTFIFEATNNYFESYNAWNEYLRSGDEPSLRIVCAMITEIKNYCEDIGIDSIGNVSTPECLFNNWVYCYVATLDLESVKAYATGVN
jgi:hypothetical protein